MTIPLVSIIMPVYNGERYLEKAIESILVQTYTNFEFIIVDDGSVDNSKKIVENSTDHRIIHLVNEENKGLAFCINRGIKISKGKYILRMDADDISLPTRIEEQVVFMENNLNIGISGTWMKFFGSSNYLEKYPVCSEECLIQLLFDVPLGHPSVIMRKSLIDEHNLYYNEELLTYGEDYDLWCRFSKHTKISNIPKPLLLYRTYDTFHKKKDQNKRLLQANIIRRQILENWFDKDDVINLNSHIILSSPLLTFNKKVTSFSKVEEWANKLLLQNHKFKSYDQKLLFTIVAKKLFLVCYHHPSFNSYSAFYKSQFVSAKIPLLWKMKFIVKILIYPKG